MQVSINMAGRKIGRLTVTGPAERPPGTTRPGTWWLCDCECGRRDVPRSGPLLRRQENGHANGVGSCGCLKTEVAARMRRVMVDLGKTVPHQCRTCGADFLGDVRQRYCNVKCCPFSLKKRKKKAARHPVVHPCA